MVGPRSRKLEEVVGSFRLVDHEQSRQLSTACEPISKDLYYQLWCEREPPFPDLRGNPSKRPERDTGYWRTYLPKIGLPVPGTLADVWPGDPRNLPGWGFDPEADEDDPRNMLA